MFSGRFGWVNASYVYGLGFITTEMKRALGALTPYETYEKAQQDRELRIEQELV